MLREKMFLNAARVCLVAACACGPIVAAGMTGSASGEVRSAVVAADHGNYPPKPQKPDVVPPAPRPMPAPKKLPFTGAKVATMTAVGGGLVAAGLALMMVVRRRRAHSGA